MEEFLSSFGYEVVTAIDGVDGLGKLSAAPFDCIICDRGMPRMDGMKMLECVRSWNEEIVFFMVTGVPDETSRRDSLKRGANDFICKPVDMADLIARIEAALERGGDGSRHLSCRDPDHGKG